jgi:heme-degrading monooxygenase HmoA
MFARVITAQTEPEGFEDAIRFAQQQLPDARQLPGFQGFYLLADDESGKLITISFWQTREQMEAVGQDTPSGIHDEALSVTGLASLHLDTYKVALQA